MEGCQTGKNNKEIKSIKIQLEDLVCEQSYNDLEITLPSVQGIMDLDIDKSQKIAYVDYDPEIISEKQINDRIAEIGCRIQDF